MKRVITVIVSMPLDLFLHKNGVDTSQVPNLLELNENRHLGLMGNFIAVGTQVTLPNFESKPIKKMVNLWG